MKNVSLALFMALACIAGPVAFAANAYTQGHVNLRAGPSADYPLVALVPPNSLLQVNGCIDDFTWCDVDWEGNRGWLYGNYLYYDYQSRRVPVLEYGAALGIGIVAFSLGDYWGRWYPSRPWYRQRDSWIHRPPPPRRPPYYRPGRPGGPSFGGGGPPGRPNFNRPQRPGFSNGGGRPGVDRPGNDRPGGDRPGGDRPNGNRPGGDRPSGNRPGGVRPGRPGNSGPGDGGAPPGNGGSRPGRGGGGAAGGARPQPGGGGGPGGEPGGARPDRGGQGRP